MSARLPRKTFAAPFVIIAACAPAPHREPIHENPPPPQPHPENPPPPREPEPPVIANPPPPHEEPPPPVADAHFEWTLTKHDGKCHVMGDVDCPKGRPGGPMPTCNPPPPREYPCPEEGIISEGGTKTIVQDGNLCRIMPQMPKCPPRTMCNPPPPRDVPCPK